VSVLLHMLNVIYSYSAVRSLHASVRCQHLSPSCRRRLKVPVLALDQEAVILLPMLCQASIQAALTCCSASAGVQIRQL
jgi:hypothetical protein